MKNAIILAAGFGIRMVPINTEVPKALLEVSGRPLIEHLILQLHEAQIFDITIVVGYMGERLEYLADKYGVTLVNNSRYSEMNNLYSLMLVADKISNTYILPCDIWCQDNPFLKSSIDSFYLVYENSGCEKNDYWEAMTGIAYITEKDGDRLRESLQVISKSDRGKEAFWEETLYDGEQLWVIPSFVAQDAIYQIDSFEDLRRIDNQSVHLHSEIIKLISHVLSISSDEISDIVALKKGMTNRSFLFSCKDEKYIMRIPGEGTDLLIDRQQEAMVYGRLDGKEICDEIIYLNPENGYKITRFVDSARSCDPNDSSDLKKCMSKLREFHSLELKVEHEFDIFAQIDFYESLRNGNKSAYDDYDQVKKRVFNLSEFIEKHIEKKVLTHIDAIPDNFLIYSKEGQEEIRLIDWEYAGMQDPHVDIAMFCIYSLYNQQEIDRLIDIYFDYNCSEEIRLKIYCYIASCGLLWSNWCEYKHMLGVDFGYYAKKQYDFARDYSSWLTTELRKRGIYE
ncbi:TPA: NTP transferase domain-containing protein [Streptococcus suis]|nr:NTP transferase domain-containing protein [Streptococcus suis]HEM3726547.1 NTP transferase domain-containing protein [Streptococcus suis]